MGTIMKMQDRPFLTTSALALVMAIHLVPFDTGILFFGTREIQDGQLWRLLTGHLVHADWNHLAWNALGLAVLGWLIERRSRRLLWLSLLAGTACVNTLLMFSSLDYYCGLSGVLNALLVVALWLEWRASHSWWVAAVATGCLLKVIVEITLGDVLVSQISWPPYAWSHVAGIAGGLIALLWRHIRTRPREDFAF
jgi:rhomboid family GlyGly-CTERM serine protease